MGIVSKTGPRDDGPNSASWSVRTEVRRVPKYLPNGSEQVVIRAIGNCSEVPFWLLDDVIEVETK